MMRKKILSLTILLSLFFVNDLFGQEYEVNFSEEYKSKNDNNVSAEISPVQELVYIILANTDFAKENPPLVKRDTEYYKKVENHFSNYADEPIVKKFDKLLHENLLYYFVLAGNAYGYNFEGNKIEPTGVYIYPAKAIGNLKITTENPIEKFIPELEKFAEETNFNQFYRDNKEYYDKKIQEYEQYAEIEKQKSWLENKFDYKINSFRVLTSPLISAMNATHTFENNNFKETLLFLPIIQQKVASDEELNKAYNTRVIFTEIDHNYVGKVSEKYEEQINKIFSDREKWLDSKNKHMKYYPSPIKVFDEYLTWGLFILYAEDNYSDKITSKVIENINETMIKRGFPKAKEFDEELLKLYRDNPNSKIEKLYPKLLNWCKRQ